MDEKTMNLEEWVNLTAVSWHKLKRKRKQYSKLFHVITASQTFKHQ
jgi:hypothetical protein